MIRVDRGAATALALCSSCPGFHALRLSTLEAWEAAAAHEQAAHPGQGQARNALYQARARG